ncbi:MAG: GNAT family N-acetyltransferase [Candidatus Woesearchaeota archaeon]
MIRKIEEKDLNEVVQLLKKFFPEHNRFSKSDEEIVDYLKKLMHKPSYQNISDETPMYIYDDNGIKGFLALVHFDGTSDGLHRIWKYKHLAFENEEIASALVDEAEKIIKRLSESVKVELTIAETEKGIDFYKSKGYEVEGTLKSHYRPDELCYILGKVLK